MRGESRIVGYLGLLIMAKDVERPLLNNWDLNQVDDLRFSLIQCIAAGAQSCRLRITGSGHY